MLIAGVKAIHIVALAVWCAGLLALPTIYASRTGLRSLERDTLHRMARAIFIAVTSPAAFIAVVAGTLLIFLRGLFTPWMALKLLVVGLLILIHVRQGFVILHLFDPDGRYARWRQWAATTATTVVIAAILWLVLAKPEIDLAMLPPVMRQPGGLQSLLDTMVPMP